MKVVLKFGAFAFWGLPEANIEGAISGKKAKFLKSPQLSLRVGPISLAYRAEEVLSAPLNSKEFEERFIRDTHFINILIKEVTLGAVARKGNNE